MSAIDRERRIGALLVTAAVWMAIPVARATVVQYGFEGVVNEIYDPSYQIYPQYIDYGSTITGTLAVDLNILDASPDSLTYGEYNNAVKNLAGRVGTLDFSQPPGGWTVIQILNDSHQGQFVVDDYSIQTDVTIFGRTARFTLSLVDWTGAALSSDVLTGADPTTPAFGANDFGLWPDSAPPFPRTRGPLMTVWLVPEPASGVVMAGAIAFVVCHRRRGRGAPTSGGGT